MGFHVWAGRATCVRVRSGSRRTPVSVLARSFRESRIAHAPIAAWLAARPVDGKALQASTAFAGTFVLEPASSHVGLPWCPSGRPGERPLMPISYQAPSRMTCSAEHRYRRARTSQVEKPARKLHKSNSRGWRLPTPPLTAWPARKLASQQPAKKSADRWVEMEARRALPRQGALTHSRVSGSHAQLAPGLRIGAHLSRIANRRPRAATASGSRGSSPFATDGASLLLRPRAPNWTMNHPVCRATAMDYHDCSESSTVWVCG